MSADVFVVTGAASGISHATAARLLGNGRSVVGVDLDEEGSKNLPESTRTGSAPWSVT